MGLLFPGLGLQFFAVLPVLQPSPDSGNSRESNGNSWESGEFPQSSSGVGNSTSLAAWRRERVSDGFRQRVNVMRNQEGNACAFRTTLG